MTAKNTKVEQKWETEERILKNYHQNYKDSEVWVKKWVDYSTKYGLGYYLSNGATGVFFNDSTKIILDPNGHHFDYMERRSSDK